MKCPLGASGKACLRHPPLTPLSAEDTRARHEPWRRGGTRMCGVAAAKLPPPPGDIHPFPLDRVPRRRTRRGSRRSPGDPAQRRLEESRCRRRSESFAGNKSAPPCRVQPVFEPAFAGGARLRGFALAQAYRVAPLKCEPHLVSVGSIRCAASRAQQGHPLYTTSAGG